MKLFNKTLTIYFNQYLENNENIYLFIYYE